MPGNLLTADTSLPKLDGNGSTNDKLKAISGYLYMLLEQLRYTLSNLGEDNFNDAELESLGKTLTAPLTVRLGSTEHGLTEVKITLGEISLRVEEAESDMKSGFSEIKQTADSITARVEKVEDGVTEFSKVTQTVEGLNIQTSDGQSSLSGVALYFRDEYGSIIGQVNMDDDGNTALGESKHRMFVGTRAANGTSYSLKLKSAGNSSYASENSIYIQAGDEDTDMVQMTGGGGKVCTNDGVTDVNSSYHNLTLVPPAGRRVAIKESGGWYVFKDDGIYHRGIRCSMSDAAANKLIDAKLKEFAENNGLSI